MTLVQPLICRSGEAFSLFTHHVHACDCCALAAPSQETPAATRAPMATMRLIADPRKLVTIATPPAICPFIRGSLAIQDKAEKSGVWPLLSSAAAPNRPHLEVNPPRRRLIAATAPDRLRPTGCRQAKLELLPQREHDAEFRCAGHLRPAAQHGHVEIPERSQFRAQVAVPVLDDFAEVVDIIA